MKNNDTRRFAFAMTCAVMVVGCMSSEQALFHEGERSLQRNEFARAESLLTAYLAHEPHDVGAWYNRALARAGHDDLPGAVTDLDRALQLAPDDRDVRWMRFRIIERQIAGLEADTSAWPLDRSVRRTWISALTVIQIHILTAMLAWDPLDHMARCERGVLYRKTGRYGEALGDLNLVLREDPADVQARTERGNTFHALGRYDDALKDYDAALSDCDTCRWLLYNKALSFHTAGRLHDAIAVLETLVAADGKDGDAWFMLGDCRLEAGRRTAACDAWRRSLDLGINEAQVRLNAWCPSR